MHSTDGNTEGITFHHNGGFDGEVIINIDDVATWKYKSHPAVERIEPNTSFNRVGYWSIRIPFVDLMGLVADYVRSKKIEELEEADDDELLGVKNG